MNPELKSTIWRQFGAAIDMLENAMRACPDNVWSANSKRIEQQFWYLAYHTLFFLDLYLSEDPEAFAPPPPFGMEELDPAGVYPDRVYSKDELQDYVNHCRAKCRATLATMTDEKAYAIWRFESREWGRAELHFYNMRHVQHHAAQLNLILRQQIDSAPRWVGKTKLALSDH